MESKIGLRVLLAALLSAWALGGTVARAADLTLNVVEKMVKLGVKEDVIRTAIRQSGTRFTLPPAEVIRLHKAGFPAGVLDELIATSRGGNRAAQPASTTAPSSPAASEGDALAARKAEAERRLQALEEADSAADGRRLRGDRERADREEMRRGHAARQERSAPRDLEPRRAAVVADEDRRARAARLDEDGERDRRRRANAEAEGERNAERARQAEKISEEKAAVEARARREKEEAEELAALRARRGLTPSSATEKAGTAARDKANAKGAPGDARTNWDDDDARAERRRAAHAKARREAVAKERREAQARKRRSEERRKQRDAELQEEERR